MHECVWVSVYVHKRGRSAGPLRVSVCCTNYEEVQDRCVCLFMCTNNGEAQDCCVFVHVYMPACNIPTCHAQKVQAANFVCVEHTQMIFVASLTGRRNKRQLLNLHHA